MAAQPNEKSVEQLQAQVAALELRLRDQQQSCDDKTAECDAALKELQATGARLQASEEQYRTIATLTSDYIYAARINLDGTLVTEWVTPAFERITSYTLDEVNSAGSWRSLIYAADLPQVEQGFLSLLANQGSSIEYRIVTKSGVVRWLYDRTQPQWDVAQQRVTRLLGTVQDITERKEAEAKRRDSEARLRAQYKSSPVPTYTWRRVGDDFVLVDYNDAAEVITEGQITTLMSQRASVIYQSRPDVFDDFERCFTEQTSIKREMPFRLASTGKDCYLVVTSSFVPPDLLMIHTEDITERKQAEQALRQYAERLKTLRGVDQAVLAAWSLQDIADAALKNLRHLVPCERVSVGLFDARTEAYTLLLVDVNGTTTWGSGKRLPTDVNGLGNIALLCQGQIRHIDDIQALPELSQGLQRLLAEGLRAYFNVPLLVQGQLIGTLNVGAKRPAAFSEEDMQVAREVADQLAVAIHHFQLYDQVRAGREQLQELSRQLLAAQEVERRHLARELHDEIGQSLTALKLNLRVSAVGANGADANASLQDSLALVDQLLTQVRALSLDLRPPMLDDLGLVAALRWYLERQAQRAGFTPDLLTDTFETRLPPHLETTCFRVAQEAVTNIVRHAQATRVRLQLRQQDDDLELIIRDNGIGFDQRAAQAGAACGSSFGLRSMQERVALIGGRLEIEAAPGHGTEIRACLPLALTATGSHDYNHARGIS